MSYILIIEDDASYSRSMKLILQAEGFTVQTAENGTAGLNLCRESRPDLILCDIMMPVMDGNSVLESLKSEKRFSDIPFVFVTAMAERGDVRGGMGRGADDYLTKPFSSEELVSAVMGRLHRFSLLSNRVGTHIFDEEFAFLSQNITEREREVLMLVGQGATSKEIGRRLDIRNNTVEVHRANLMRKLDVPNAANLARWAVIAELMNSAERS
ncbi:MAG: response regulator transcription factor [Desulfuromonadaceae bacterium]|nr:response regulator transcription factor [Desulfuromonadaceae bacterium]MDD2856817.1 response regulator transcription factor [Desulfuromonadaceae bacterium]